VDRAVGGIPTRLLVVLHLVGSFLQGCDRTPPTHRQSPWPVAAIVEHALAVFPGQQPARDRDVREAQVEALGPAALAELERLDAAFLAYPEPLARLERTYVQAHRAEFIAPPNADKSLMP
jgi:hypothetical protein